MEKSNHITTLFLDIGGVLLSDGWDRDSRKAGAETFHLDHHDLEERHHLNFETYELGKMSLDEYLDSVVFYKKRDFNRDEFKTFMYEQSRPQPEMITLIIKYRIKKFKLNTFIDFFISSSFVNLRKPDAAIVRLALDIAQVDPGESIYIDNQVLFVEIAERFGMKGIWHTNLHSTADQLNAFGLTFIPATHE